MVVKYGSVILVNKVVVNDFEVAVRINEDLVGVKTDEGFELAESVSTRL